MKKRGILNLILIFSVLILLGLYFAMAFYYRGSFSYGTWVNHVYCTGRNIDEVNEELKENTFYNGLVIKGRGGDSFFVDPKAIGFSVDYRDDLTRLLNEQNPLAWGLD